MRKYALGLDEVDGSMADLVGGKAANLGELRRIAGVRVPDGFCVTAEALEAAWPEDLGAEVAKQLARLGLGCAVAVRSSAVGEDAPGASFAGQYESYLGVVGVDAVLDHVRRCWASRSSERAIAYRRRNGLADGAVRMAVVVQRMVAAEAAGVMFTADPVHGDRKVVVIEAVHGLGDALVAGHVDAEGYRVRDGKVIAAPAQPLLDADQALALARLGRTIEAHFGAPQDLEWCLADGAFHVVQSRPITTLFPIPGPSEPGNRVYLSTGHQQMMTDAMKPLGLAFFQMTAGRPMVTAGGRLFVDITPNLATAAGRAMMLAMMGQHDPLTQDAVAAVLDRDDFLPPPPDAGAAPPPPPAPPPPEVDPTMVATLIADTQASLAELRAAISTKAGPALLDFIEADVPRMKALLHDPRGTAVFMPAMQAATWLNEHAEAWLGEKGVADVLAQSAPHNVTSAMGLALMDVADVLRPHPEVVAYLGRAPGAGFLDGLAGVEGGPEARAAIEGFLATYGMRCAGEIDITRPRWAEDPAALVPVLLGNLKRFGPGAARRKSEAGLEAASAKERELLDRLRALPDGEAKAAEAKHRIDVLRAYIGYREYPKFGMISRYALYREALWREADRLVRDGAIHDRDDVGYLDFEELREAVATGRVDKALLARRKADHARFTKLTPPRVITSDGEIPAGRYRREGLPAGALVGLGVSAGVVEGRARVVARMEDADLEAGDILVTTFTDPSWTPLLAGIRGLVTEVGGLMTHGAVIAREYGLPAVVGVVGATRLIEDGRRIRVHGTEGWIERL